MPRILLLVLLLGLAAYRLTLVDRGHFFWRDEYRYLSAGAMLDHFEAGRYQEAFSQPFQCLGRPAFVLFSVLPTLLQRQLASIAGIDPNGLKAYGISCGFQILVSLGVTICVYLLARTWTDNSWHGFLAAFIFSLLCFSNLWIRHLMPYYTSLVFFLSGLVVICRQVDNSRFPRGYAWLAGMLTLLGFAVYPAYYLFVALNGIVLATVARDKLRCVAEYIVGACCVVGALEAIARLGNVSYLSEIAATLFEHADQKDQGYGPEGYVFAWRYLYDVEGPAGMIVLGLFVIGAALALLRLSVEWPRSLKATMAATMGCYLLHASASVLLNKTIFFGRFFGMYLPIMVCVAVFVVKRLNTGLWQRLTTGTLVAASLCSFAMFAIPYSQLTYPAEFLAQTVNDENSLGGFTPNVIWAGSSAWVREEKDFTQTFCLVLDTHPEGAESPTIPVASHQAAYESDCPWIGVNLSWVFRYRDRWCRFAAPPKYELVAEAAHPTSFPAITYEAYKPWERRRLGEQVEIMRIYRRRPDAEYKPVLAHDCETVRNLP
ncbi:MAG: hypothetical protein AABZ47_08225 [Planctomycetota bacterium]